MRSARRQQPPADDALPGLPSADPSDASTPALPPETAVGFESPNADVLATAGEIIRVSTDVFEIEINTAGGKLQRAVLKNYPVAKDQPDTLVELLSTEELRFASIQSGLIADTGDGEAYFNALLKSEARNYALNGDDELLVPLTMGQRKRCNCREALSIQERQLPDRC